MSLPDDDLLILGDQNVPEFYNESLNRGSKFESLNNLIDMVGLSQFNEHCNRLSNTVLDLVFSNTLVHVSPADNILSKPDLFHPPIIIIKNQIVEPDKPTIQVFRNWKTANWRGIRLELANVDWKPKSTTW